MNILGKHKIKEKKLRNEQIKKKKQNKIKKKYAEKELWRFESILRDFLIYLYYFLLHDLLNSFAFLGLNE